MKGRRQFSESEAQEIRNLLFAKCRASRDEQKRLRRLLRSLGFFISDFGQQFGGFCIDDFNALVEGGEVKIISDLNSLPRTRHAATRKGRSRRTTSDETYILDLCDGVLGQECKRQHTFLFLKGDAGTLLPVDGFYPELSLVIEYYERQHTEAVGFFDCRETASGMSRGEQRKRYDELRRNVLPQHGIDLVILSYSEFSCTSGKRLIRNPASDKDYIRTRFERWIKKD